MDHLVQIILLLAVAVATMIVFQRLHVPTSLGYLLVGLILGPHTIGPTVHVGEFKLLAEFGVVFLMFTLGLEFSVRKLKKVGHVIFPTALLDMAVMIWAGHFVGTTFLGWGSVQSLFLGAAIAAVSDRKDIPYQFKVLNSKEVNALAVPGGYIYLFKGLVDYMPSDHELAGIIGHEVGHIVKRHTVVQIERSLAVGVLFAILFGNSNSAILGDLIGSALMAGYSREAEREADNLGVVHTMRAGYNPYSMLVGMEKLEAMSGKANYGLFSTHPDTVNRVNAIRGQINNDFKVRPVVTEKDKTAQVVDGAWSLPAFHVKYAGYTPRMRAHLAAGKI